MRKTNRNYLGLLASGILACLSATAGAQIFTDGFNAAAGNQNNTQGTTTFAVQTGANYDNWGITGSSGHQVDLNPANAGMVSGNPESLPNPNNWAAMLLFNQVLTSNATIAANTIGLQYTVDYLAGPADYAGGQGSATANGNGLRIEVIDNNGAGSVIGTKDFTAVDFASLTSNLDLGLSSDNFTYNGSGNGDVKIRITGLGSGVFKGSIDSISVSELTAGAISITSFTATPDTLADTEDAVTFDWTVTGMPLDSLEITPGNIDVLGDTDGAGVGSYLLDPGPDGTTEYTLTAMKGGDTATRMVTVTLPAPEITSFTASPVPVAPGGDLTLSWQVGLPATTLTIDPGGIDVSGDTDGGGAGSIIVNPTESTSYTLTATRGTSTSDANAFASVQTPPNPDALVYENFDGISGLSVNGGPNGQVTTTHELGFGGTLAGWSKGGAGAIHAVDTANTWTGGVVTTNPANWGVMIWQDNVITQTAGTPGSNDSGVGYSIDFLAAGAVYENLASQVNDGTTDGLKIEVLRASDDAVLHTFDQVVAQPIGVGNLGLTPYSFNYTGDGSGDIKFRIGPVNANQGRFQGTIDDLQLSVAGSAPLITSITAIGGGVFELTLLGAADTGYEFRSSPILDFDPGALVENLTAGVPAVGTIGGDNDSVVTTDDNGDDTGDATVRMTLAGLKNFVVAQIPPPPPPLFSEDFEADDGGFAAIGTPNDWEWGTPDSTNGFGLTLNSDNSTNCWGTKFTGGTPPVVGGITVGADSILRGPDPTGTGIDLTGVSAAELRFAAAVDAKTGDTLEVLVKEVGTDTILVTLTPITGFTPAVTKAWTSLGPFDISGAATKNAYLEFRFLGTDDTYIGLYIDDVVVTDTTP